MRRINTLNKDTDAFGAGKHGWKNGVPGTVNRPTEGQAEWFNAVQEEVARAIEAAGIVLDPERYDQLQAAIRYFAGPGNPSVVKSLPDVGVTTGAFPAANLTALNAALATQRSRLFVPEGDFNVSGVPSNPFGTELAPGGRIQMQIAGGMQQLNSYGDLHKYVFGQEYMAAFHKVIMANARAPKALFSGDSTTAGTAVDAEFQIHALVKKYGVAKGLNTAFGLNFINAGHAGWNTEMWRQYTLADDLAADPDAYVMRWGINDPGYYSNDFTTGPVQDSGQGAAGRRTPADFITSLRLGLAQARAERDVSQMSIVLMAPNATSDTPNGRDERWYEQIIAGIKQAARDFQCCFIDTYAYFRDARVAANIWMDKPFADNRAIHPLNVMNTWIAGLIGSVMFPEGLATSIGRTQLRTVGGSEDAGDVSREPAWYPYGVTLSRANGAGFPYDGVLQTTRWHDEVVVQYCFPYKTSQAGQYACRVGRAIALSGDLAGWEPWVLTGRSSLVAVTPSAGYTNPAVGGMRVAKLNGVCTVEGYISKTAPGAIAANTQVATIPAGSQPQREALVGYYASGFDGANWEPLFIRIAVGGEISLLKASTNSVSRIYIGATWNTDNTNAA